MQEKLGSYYWNNCFRKYTIRELGLEALYLKVGKMKSESINCDGEGTSPPIAREGVDKGCPVKAKKIYIVVPG